MAARLRGLEREFPDKTSISLDAARQFVQDITGQEIPDEPLKEFLLEKGYREIVETEEVPNGDIHPDEILEMEFAIAEDMAEADAGHDAWADNTVLLHSYIESGGDLRLLEKLIEKNMGLVQKQAKHFWGNYSMAVDEDDLIAEGLLGLMKAIQRFDPSKNLQMSTYAHQWIRQSMRRAVKNMGSTIRVPVHMHELILRINKYKNELQEKGEAGHEAGLCKDLGLSVDGYRHAMLVQHQFLKSVYLNTYAGENQDTELLDFIAGNSEGAFGQGKSEALLDPALHAQWSNMREALAEILETRLTPRERDVLRQRFGLLDDDPKTLQRIGEEYGVTRERVRQIQNKALAKVRQELNRRGGYENWQWPQGESGA